MKKHFTKLVLLIFTIAFFGQYTTAQTVIWGGPGDKNGEFDGGLNDWTAKSIKLDTVNFLWKWEADAKADLGTYSGNGSILFSPSASNGAAVYDSDYYDGNVEAGVQEAELISPVFSCANNSTVWLKFYQSFRKWHGVSKVAVSNDGGEEWSPAIEINSELAINASTKTNSVIFLNISEYAANQENVRIKFIWEDRYYYWIIDDVTVLDGLNADPRIVHTWYPGNRYYTPKSQTVNVPMKFKMSVNNFGDNRPMTGIKAKVSIVKEYAETTLFEDSRTFDLDTGIVDTLDFGSYTPTSMLDTGLYRAVYTIEYENAASDFGKTVTHYFRVTDGLDETWDPNDRILEYNDYLTYEDNSRVRGVGWQGGSSADVPIYFLSYYKTGDWVESENIQIRTVALNQRVGTFSGNGLKDFPFSMAMFSVADTIAEDFNNFGNGKNDGLVIDKENVNLEYLGAVDETVDNADDYSFLEFPIIDADGENEYVDMHPNTKYLISTFFDKNESVYYFVGYDNSGPADDKFNSESRYTFDEQVTALRYYPGDQGGWAAFRGNYGAWMLGAKLNFVIIPPSGNKEVSFEENTVQFANPVKEKLVVNIKFDKIQDHASMVIHDINGNIIEMRNMYNIKEDVQTFNTGSLPTGTYIFTLFTKDKLLSKKFVVAK